MTGWDMISLDMITLSDWMIDTFIYTALLIGLVLLVRRPVAQFFGPQIAYALWALPLLRFMMPPIVLPAWMKPAAPAATAAPAVPVAQGSEVASADPAMTFLADAPALANAPAIAGEAVMASAPGVDLSIAQVLLPLWLAGAAIFLIWRARDYVRMRRDLLADARPMGEAGEVRLVETPAVSAPVAFGVFDKVVALPPDFMALIDVKARDMAIAHELEHHRGHDLLANIAAQPLLALHWFNPLAQWGWRAMRRDQEAACDARVVAGRARSERAAYAQVIAGFASGKHLALAAPMACPVLGEKSIIHRLRSLTMNDVSRSRRRIGIAAITTTALALPLTASISYAAPQDPGQDQDADAPAIESAEPGQDRRVVRIERRVERDGENAGEGDVQVEIDENSEHHVEVRVIREGAEGENGERRVVRRIVRRGEHGEFDEAEIERMMAELERELEGLDGEVERHVELALAHSARAAEMADRFVVIQEGEEGSHSVSVRCDGQQPVVHQDLGDGRRAMVVCHSAIAATTVSGLRAGISAVANNPNIPAETREEVIRELEQAIEEVESAGQQGRRVSFRVTPPAPPAPPKAPRASVGFRFSSGAPPRVQRIPMVSPITGVSIAAPRDEECREETRTTARAARVNV